jgi:Domain of unknown function (DUF3472)./Ricin-type beta-trefoil lectin domain.
MRPILLAIAVVLFIGAPAHAQHLWWDLGGQEDATCLYGTITVLSTYRDIYYCGASWHPGGAAGGYVGIQHNNEKERRTIFSIWDTAPDLHPKATAADPEAVISRFGGEGEGEHTHMVLPWNVGEKIEYFLQKQKGEDGKTTNVLYYIYNRGTKRWRHVATIRCPIGGQRCVETIGGGLNSFLENFSGKEKERPKLALYGIWLGNSIEEMKPLTRAGGDGTWGQLDNSYFLAEGTADKLDAVFRGVERKYGKPVFGGEGKKLEPINANPLSPEVVKALKELPRAEPLQENSDVPRDGATYVLRNISTRKEIVPDRDRTKIVQRAGKSNAAWKLKAVGDCFVIANATNGMVLDASADQVTQRRLNGAAGQAWTFVKEGDGYYIQCKGTGRVLDLEGGSIDDGARILMWDMKKPPGHLNQIWMLTLQK